MARKKNPKPSKRQTTSKKATPLKRYNKIVSLIVKDNKKKGIAYNISDVRKQVSESVYPSLKNVAPSKITYKKVGQIIGEQVPKEETVKILAENIPREYFDITLEWFELGEEKRNNGEINPILEINRLYPEIPIVIKTGDKELRLKGSIGEYQGGHIQKFVEELRLLFDNKSGFVFSGVPTWFDRKNKQYALWGTEDIAEDLPPENILDYVDAGEQVDLTEQRVKKPKVEKDKPKDKPKPPKEEPITTKDKGENVAKISADFREREKELLELFKEGVYTKEEFKAERKDLKNQLNLALSKFLKGGKI